MAIVFLSYRRDDSEDVAGRIHDELIKHFGKDDVFMDTDSIPDGADFVRIIQDQVHECQVMLVVIGRNWVGRLPTKKRRIDDPDDFVRLEVQAALQRGMPVIPLLVSRATMPSPADLPDTLRRLTRLNARPVRPNPDFHRDMEKVIAAVETQGALWLAAEQEREEQARRASETRSKKAAEYVDSTAGLGESSTIGLSRTERTLANQMGTMSRYVFRALNQIVRVALVGALIAAILAAAATIGVGSWLTDRFPPGLPAYIAAAWSALTTGGLVAAVIALEEVLRAIIRAVELLVEESERLVADAIKEAERLGAIATDEHTSHVDRRDISAAPDSASGP